MSLDEIREREIRARCSRDASFGDTDRTVLLAEVDRLRAENEGLRVMNDALALECEQADEDEAHLRSLLGEARELLIAHGMHDDEFCTEHCSCDRMWEQDVRLHDESCVVQRTAAWLSRLSLSGTAEES